MFRFMTTFIIMLLFVNNTHATIFGLKNCGSNSQGNCTPNSQRVSGDGSTSPTVLFSFEENGVTLNSNSVEVLRNGFQVHADGLAINSSNTLFAFDLNTTISNQTNELISSVTSSTLITINPDTGIATTIGSALLNRNIRGAAFGTNDRLWAIDVNNNEILEINSNNGAVISAKKLSINGQIFYTSSTGVDIAFDSDCQAFLIYDNDLFTLNVNMGTMGMVGQDFSNGRFFAGLAFSNNPNDNLLFGYEVNDSEDIFIIDISSNNTINLQISNLLPILNGSAFNAGRGDLASKVNFQCCLDNSATVFPNLDIHLPSVTYQSLTDTLNLWVQLEYYGDDGDYLLWKLKDFGENAVACEFDDSVIVLPNLDIQLSSIDYLLLSGALNLWANFEYFGQGTQGELLWKLIDYGEN